MKKIAFLFLTSFIFLIMSCKDNLRVPISQTLPIEDLRESIETDPSFEAFYNRALKLHEWVCSTDIRQAKWGNITYAELNDFYMTLHDSSFYNRALLKAKEEHEKRYRHYKEKVDSIADYWRCFIRNKSDSKVLTEYLKQYVDIQVDFIGLKLHFYSALENMDPSTFEAINFKVTPLKGNIQNIEFSYTINSADKSSIENESKSSKSYADTCSYYEDINEPTIIYTGTKGGLSEVLTGLDFENYNKNYNFSYILKHLVVGGKDLVDLQNLIPNDIYNYLEYEHNKFYYDVLVKNMIDYNYTSLDEVTRTTYKNLLKEKYPDICKLLLEYQRSI